MFAHWKKLHFFQNIQKDGTFWNFSSKLSKNSKLSKSNDSHAHVRTRARVHVWALVSATSKKLFFWTFPKLMSPIYAIRSNSASHQTQHPMKCNIRWNTASDVTQHPYVTPSAEPFSKMYPIAVSIRSKLSIRWNSASDETQHPMKLSIRCSTPSVRHPFRAPLPPLVYFF